MKPYAFSVSLSAKQKKFNYHLSKCRRVVENAFGHLKTRFRRIGKGIDNRVGNAPKIIRACCVLHNFLNDQNDNIKDIPNSQQEIPIREHLYNTVVLGDSDPSAEKVREALCTYFGKLFIFFIYIFYIIRLRRKIY